MRRVHPPGREVGQSLALSEDRGQRTEGLRRGRAVCKNHEGAAFADRLSSVFCPLSSDQQKPRVAGEGVSLGLTGLKSGFARFQPARISGQK
jgi:hypothetical protein